MASAQHVKSPTLIHSSQRARSHSQMEGVRQEVLGCRLFVSADGRAGGCMGAEYIGTDSERSPRVIIVEALLITLGHPWSTILFKTFDGISVSTLVEMCVNRSQARTISQVIAHVCHLLP